MKKILSLLLSLLILIGFSSSISANDIKVIDENDYLTLEEEETLTSLVNDFVSSTGYDMVIYYAYNHNEYFDNNDYDSAITALADDYFDFNGYGVGQDKNGIIICVDFGYGTYTITTCGQSCINTFSDKSLDYIYDNVTPLLSNGEYFNAAINFINCASDIATYDYESYDSLPYSEPVKTTTDYLKQALLIGAGVALVVAAICFLIFYKQLKHTGEKVEASHYIKGADINILRSGEIYLYTTRSRRLIKTESDSSTHISSSGSTHGGGGSHSF